MYVAGLELDNVDVSRLLHARQMLGGQHSSLAQIRAEVVDEHAAYHVFHASVVTQTVRLHLLAA